MALSVTQLYEVMAQLPDPVFILSEDGYYVEYIGGMEQQSYHDGNPLAGKQLADVLPPEMAMWVKAQVAESLASGQVRVVEYELSAAEVGGINAAAGPQGIQRFEGKIAPLPSLYDGKRAVAWVTRNITRQYELQQRLLRQSETDQLTGLYNRRFFFEHCQPLRAGDAPCGLIMLDIDHFKQLNDRYGHQQGDRALQRFSSCIDALLRADDLFVRSGGEEFLILLPRIDEAG
ncbi:MAG: diguanylate cyclase, partial [Aeromonas veronii]